jgi:glycosyltransferase involved in cell wall biosynthesis
MDRKLELYKNARALLFPILWEEPFGLVMIEAMATGTPVIAYRRGAIPEVVSDGVTGFIVDTEAQLMEKAGIIGSISRKNCRSWVEEKFTVSRMIDSLERALQQAVHV